MSQRGDHRLGAITPDEQEPVRGGAIIADAGIDPRSGALYAVWQDVRFRGVEEVAFSRSIDGKMGSAPIRINRTPGNALRQQAILPAIEVGSGVLVVTYYDFRNDVATPGRELNDYWAVFCDPVRTDCGDPGSWG